MTQTFRVKAFLFIRGENKHEAESTAKLFLAAAAKGVGSDILVGALVREGSAKSEEEEKKPRRKGHQVFTSKIS